MRLMHRFVLQHGLADDVADGEDMGHVGAHLDIDVDKAAVTYLDKFLALIYCE